MDRGDLVGLTADIVAAHVSNNVVAISDMPMLVARVHGALEGLGNSRAPTEAKRSPVVPVRKSVTPDFITCLICARRQKTLKRHLMTAHAMTPDQYRSEFGLPDGYPMVAPAYSKHRQQIAIAHRLGRRDPPARSGRKKKAAAARR